MKAEYPDAKMLLHWEVPEQTVQENISEMGGVWVVQTILSITFSK